MKISDNFATLLNAVLKDESTNFICGAKDMMVSCNLKYEPSFNFIKNAMSTPQTIAIEGVTINPADNSDCNFFKDITVKSIVYSDNDIFVVLSFDCVFNIDKEELKAYSDYINNPRNSGKVIDRDFYKKYRKYFYILNKEQLIINSEGLLCYLK